MSRTKNPGNFRFEFMHPHDARLGWIFDDLAWWHHHRYGALEGHCAWGEIHHDMNEQLTRERGGVFLAMFEDDLIVATGAARRQDDETAVFEKIWAHPERRGRGLASMLLARLETEIRRMGYRKVYLTTGPSQPETDRLYQRNGFTAHFDPELAVPHIYTKALVRGVDATALPTQAARALVEYGKPVKTKRRKYSTPDNGV